MDRARWTTGGELDYPGRTDFQVKVRAFRTDSRIYDQDVGPRLRGRLGVDALRRAKTELERRRTRFSRPAPLAGD